MMAFAFLESLLVTFALALLSAILPSNWLRDGFVYKGFIAITMATIAAIILQRTLQGEYPAVQILTLIWFTPLVWTAIFIFVVERRPNVQRALINIADRVSIMVFVYVPIGMISFIALALRNLL